MKTLQSHKMRQCTHLYRILNQKYKVIPKDILTNAKKENKALKKRLRELDAQEAKIKEEVL